MTVKDVNTVDFNKEVLESDIPVLVDFWAPWCGPCRQVAPILKAIADANEDKVRVVKVDIDENPELAEKYRITSIPNLKVFVGGAVEKTIVGAKPRVVLERELSEWI